ncbi:hypothetical protein [Azorhizobium doebereinerae]|uniref:hypothetical protein n=1 Tax=Azorhizobium doebereinerae TaxID=281091 RepID=UPI00040C193C|nr:hypothetical protein [Azorhizobium doebereinerae]
MSAEARPDIARAVEIARQMDAARLPRRVAIGIPTDEIMALARAVLALNTCAEAAVAFAQARSEHLTANTMAEEDAAIDEMWSAADTLAEALAAAGYVTITEQELTDGSAA